jgi:hypothetical protein
MGGEVIEPAGREAPLEGNAALPGGARRRAGALWRGKLRFRAMRRRAPRWANGSAGGSPCPARRGAREMMALPQGAMDN